jgi:hypothetical protein
MAFNNIPRGSQQGFEEMDTLPFMRNNISEFRRL